MESKRLTGLRKRQQIEKANKTMFLWVVVASVVVAFALVAAQFLFKQAAFNQKIISAKSQTSDTLDDNLKNASALKAEVNKLIANQALASARPQPVDPNKSNLQVVLDALPTENDPAALAASLQHAILDKSGVSIESMTVFPNGLQTQDTTAVAIDEPVEMPFEMILQGNFDQTKAALTDLERVIRPMHIRTIKVQGSDNQLRTTIEGVTYHLPAKTVNVTKKTIKP